MNTSQDQSFSVPEIRVVEASAGSGKTYALAKRYVQLLIDPSLPDGEIPLRHILAITFTNKATVEMKERILEFLKKIALDAFSSEAERGDILAALGVPPAVARRRAEDALRHIIKNYNFFQVQTIDSFVNAIISGCAYNLNLSSGFEIKTDFSDYLAYGLDTLIDRAGSDRVVAALFKDFLLQYIHVENRAGWFPREGILAVAGELYNAVNTYGGSFRKHGTGDAASLFAMKSLVFEQLQELHGRLPEGTNKTFAKSLGSYMAKCGGTFTVDGLSKSFRREEFPANKGATVPEEIDALWDTVRHGIARVCRQEARTFYDCYIDIFEHVFENFRFAARKNDVLFLSELNRQAAELFEKNEVQVPELYYRLATRFRHFLIDEFQDTSGLQWRNLLPLVEEVLASGGSLFYVGDRKQAIYRFRGGDSELFSRIQGDFASYSPRPERLGRNFRSHREIIAFNNEVFAKDNLFRFIGALQAERDEDDQLAAPEVEEIAAVFADSAQEHRDDHLSGYVRIEHVTAGTAQERNELVRAGVVKRIAELKERFSYRDIAVLTRDNRDVELVTGWLLEAKIPVESEKTLNIRENPLVKELVSLVMFLNSPIDDLAFASFVTGAIFAKATGLAPARVKDFLSTVKRARTREGGYLYRAFREEFPDQWKEYLDNVFVSVGFVPLYELVAGIIAAFRVAENFPGQYVFFMRFLELVKEQEEENAGIGGFVDYFRTAKDDDLYVTVTDSDSVRLLTVHKSKGLEFPVVIIPFLEMDFAKVGGRGGFGSYSLLREEGQLSLVRLKKEYTLYCDDLRRLYVRRYVEAMADELNAVYVALTRPRCELYAFVPDKAGRAPNPVRTLFPEPLVERGQQVSYVLKSSGKEHELVTVPVPSFRDWLSVIKEEFTDTDRLKNRDYAERGEFLHAGLSLLPNLHGRDPLTEVKKAVARARARFPHRTDHAEMEDLLCRLVTGPGTRPFFDVPGGRVYTEREIVLPSGGARRLDRLVVTPDEARVVDYKSSEGDKARYRAQVHEYMTLLGELYPGKTVKGFIIYLNSLSVEETVQ